MAFHGCPRGRAVSAPVDPRPATGAQVVNRRRRAAWKVAAAGRSLGLGGPERCRLRPPFVRDGERERVGRGRNGRWPGPWQPVDRGPAGKVDVTPARCAGGLNTCTGAEASAGRRGEGVDVGPWVVVAMTGAGVITQDHVGEGTRSCRWRGRGHDQQVVLPAGRAAGAGNWPGPGILSAGGGSADPVPQREGPSDTARSGGRVGQAAPAQPKA